MGEDAAGERRSGTQDTVNLRLISESFELESFEMEFKHTSEEIYIALNSKLPVLVGCDSPGNDAVR